MLRHTVTFIFILLSLVCHAQSFSGKCTIRPVEESGYYHILLHPDVLAVSRFDLSDIRIKEDQSNKEVPYLVRTENFKTPTTSFHYYKLLENEFDKKDSINRIIVDNETKEEISRFYIIIQNAEISKFISIKGSDDQKNWYVVKQIIPVDRGIKNDASSEILTIDLPSGNYRYYEILLGNSQKDPFRVLNIGKYQYGEIRGKYTEVPLNEFARKDSSDKKTYISFPSIKRNYPINRLCLYIDSNKPYHRELTISELKYGNGKSILRPVVSESFSLSSDRDNTIDLHTYNINKDTRIVIDNKDNSPLYIQKISAFQLNRYVTVYLEKGKHYLLYCGAKDLSAPQYDLAYFEKEIPQELPVLELQAMEDILQQPASPIVKEQRFIETSAFLWIVMGGVGILLIWICSVMIGEMKKRK